ncbi:MAG: CDP-archaeol synthase [Lamprobacter sp.]|uniref:CDP-archaeol synthase n=1 Tax=Lamprobacter sp. TaxID=3100796 RepID=UPI002B2598A2|nr:CDP-archaeol synthase [Lamprobacter sp.]MEA3641119.1 CDP-archaeol synthase [Lamprobacter sp.]
MDLSRLSTDLLFVALITVANGAPWLLGRCFGVDQARPVDAGLRFADGRPLLGPSKTWRGLAAAMIATPIFALLMGWPVWLGLAVGGAAMIGDLLASFLKRRLGLASSTSAPGLDQIPEALLPVLVATFWLDLDWFDLGLVVWIFLIGHLLVTHLIPRLLRSDSY